MQLVPIPRELTVKFDGADQVNNGEFGLETGFRRRARRPEAEQNHLNKKGFLVRHLPHRVSLHLRIMRLLHPRVRHLPRLVVCVPAEHLARNSLLEQKNLASVKHSG
jgi:hypothetical protein